MPASHIAFLGEFVQGKSGSQAPGTATGVLNDMYVNFARNLESAVISEGDQNRKFESLMASTDKETKTMKETRRQQAIKKAQALATLADTTKAYDDTEKQLKAETEFFDQMKVSCEGKHKAYADRVTGRTEEL